MEGVLCGEWKEKESLEISETPKVLRCDTVYEKENEGGEVEKGGWYSRLVGHTMK